jgi:hypothetical protein
VIKDVAMDIGEQQDAVRGSLSNLAKYTVNGLRGQIVRNSFPHKTCRLCLIKVSLSEHFADRLPIEINRDESNLLE